MNTYTKAILHHGMVYNHVHVCVEGMYVYFIRNNQCIFYNVFIIYPLVVLLFCRTKSNVIKMGE